MAKYSYGIDVSEFQAGLDLAEHGPDFVIIRYADGDYKDFACQDFINQAAAAGIPYGLYYLIRSASKAEAKKEAADILAFADSQKVRPSMGIWADVEDRDSRLNMALAADQFCYDVQKGGYYAGIYCNWDYYKDLYPLCSDYDCWIANWSGVDPNDSPGTMQQYGTSGGVLDQDVSFVPLETYNIRKDNRPEPVEPEPEPDIQSILAEIREKLNQLEALINET